MKQIKYSQLQWVGATEIFSELNKHLVIGSQRLDIFCETTACSYRKFDSGTNVFMHSHSHLQKVTVAKISQSREFYGLEVPTSC